MAKLNSTKQTPSLLRRGLSDSDALSQLLDLVEVLPILTEDIDRCFDHLPCTDPPVDKARTLIANIHANHLELAGLASRLKYRGLRYA